MCDWLSSYYFFFDYLYISQIHSIINTLIIPPIKTMFEFKNSDNGYEPDYSSDSSMSDDDYELTLAREQYHLIIKPCQSGKTFTMLRIISEKLKNPDKDNRKNLIFIMNDNSLLSVNQTTHRYNEKFSNSLELLENSVEFSSKAKDSSGTKAAKSILEVMGHIYEGVQCVSCCSHSKRVDDICSIVKRLEKNPLTRGKFKYTIFSDESDKFMKYLEKIKNSILDVYSHSEIYFLTATPTGGGDPTGVKSLFRLFDKLKIANKKYIDDILPIYSAWEDTDRKIYDQRALKKQGVSTSTEFIEHVLKKESGNILPGQKWLIPINTKKTSHNDIAAMCIMHGFNTIIINGDGILIKGVGIDAKEPKTGSGLEKILPKLYSKYNLGSKPLAITGKLCIARAITISSNDFIITHGICHFKIGNKSEAYQHAGRFLGNQKNWENYKAPIVHCTDKYDNLIKHMQKIAVMLPTLSDKDGYVTPKTIRDNFTTNSKTVDYKEGDLESGTFELDFTSANKKEKLEELNMLCKKLIQERNKNQETKSRIRGSGVRMSMLDDVDENGFLKTSITSKKSVFSISEIKTKTHGFKGTAGFATSSTRMNMNEYKFRTYIGYKDITDKESSVFYTRWIQCVVQGGY